MLKRNTIQRQLTYETVSVLANHPTAEEVYKEIVKKIPSISRTTVYRNLNELVDDKKLLKVSTTEGADHFDHQCHNHFHAKCLSCGAVFDVNIKSDNVDLLKKVYDDTGFLFTGYDLVFKGLCKKCQNNNKEE